MPFEFSEEKRTVVRLRQGDATACYHLSKGLAHWILRRHGTGTSYRPGLLDLPPGTEVIEELTLDQVQQHTGYPAKTTSVVKDSGTWDGILAALGLPLAGDNENDAAVAPAPPLAQPPEAEGMGRRIIPATDMRHLYMVLKDFSSAEFHAAMAREAERAPVPRRLAERFRTSVDQFSVYCNVEESFYPDDRPDVPQPADLQEIESTYALTGLLLHQCSRIGEVVNAPELSFTYVDREIIPARTTGGAVYADGRPAVTGKRLDWLLATRRDHHPIIAEVKVGNDMNPFYALVQMLMYAAELVTLNQARRLIRCYEALQIAGLDGLGDNDLPSVDLYLVLCDYNQRSPVRGELFEVTERLCECLMEEPAATSHIRRIACLDAHLDDQGHLRFSQLFHYPRR